MSGDERRGTDGGEHPLDVDARFADIIAHFHDGEPAPPRVIDGDGRDARDLQDVRDAHDPADGTDDGEDGDDRDDAVAHGGTASLFDLRPDGATGERDGRPRRGEELSHGYDSRADEAATDWAARYEQAAREELAAHEQRVAREREARISAEVDRAVEGPEHRFVPAEPPPLPRPADLPARLAWGAVLLGPVVLVLFALLWRSAPPWLVGSVVTAIVAGFGWLVWRLPRTHDRDDGGDGAIV